MTRFRTSTRERMLVVSFDSTASALALQACAETHGLIGRLIPIPRSLSGACGMAWREPIDNRPLVEEALAQEGIDYDRLIEMEL